MIRYPLPADLLKEIEAKKPGWLKRADARTRKFRAARKYREKKGVWGEIKPVFMKIQHNKCVYCERQLAGLDHGGEIKHDLEHYRPKSSARAWPPPEGDEDGVLRYTFPTGAPLKRGYYWLAYDPANYAVGCKKCNSPLKSNFFPIAGDRGRSPATPAELASERPYLVYPLGAGDENPADLITFKGITAIHRKKTGPGWRRARVMIDFFKLNLREELLRDRANQLIRLANALTVLQARGVPTRRKERAVRDIARLLRPSSPHSSCVCAAKELYESQPSNAWAAFDAAEEYLDSLS